MFQVLQILPVLHIWHILQIMQTLQVSRDCFALQWFEDKLGCHGGVIILLIEIKFSFGDLTAIQTFCFCFLCWVIVQKMRSLWQSCASVQLISATGRQNRFLLISDCFWGGKISIFFSPKTDILDHSNHSRTIVVNDSLNTKMCKCVQVWWIKVNIIIFQKPNGATARKYISLATTILPPICLLFQREAHLLHVT